MPILRSVRRTRHAIAPRFAMRTRSNILVRFNSGSVPNEQTDRGRIVGVAWVVELRAVRDEDENIHLGAHLEVDDPDDLAGRQLVREAAAGGNDFVEDRLLRVEVALLQYRSHEALARAVAVSDISSA